MDPETKALFDRLDREDNEAAKLGRIIKAELAAFDARCGDGSKNGCAKVAIHNLKETNGGKQ